MFINSIMDLQCMVQSHKVRVNPISYLLGMPRGSVQEPLAPRHQGLGLRLSIFLGLGWSGTSAWLGVQSWGRTLRPSLLSDRIAPALVPLPPGSGADQEVGGVGASQEAPGRTDPLSDQAA